jgi:drug/metabolite transporter (DMT)-like permease
MQPWVGASLGAAVLIAGHYLLLRAASGRLGDTLGALVLEGAAVVGIALNFMFGPRGPALATTRLGLVLSSMSGLCISGASILLFSALRRGGPVAATGTIVLGGGVTLSALVAPWVFAEGFTMRRIVGVGLGVAAMVVLSMDGSTPRSPEKGALTDGESALRAARSTPEEVQP